MNFIKKSRLFITLFGVSAVAFGTSNANNQEPEWYETNEWYENELGAQKNEVNPVHLAVTLSECFSHDPEDVVAFDKAIKFWVSRGGDINQTFNATDFFALMCWQQEFKKYSESYKNKPITVLMLFVGVHTIVQALLQNQATVVINNESILDCWANQYAGMKRQDKNNEIGGCCGCIDIAYQWQHHALKALFAASNEQNQLRFLDMNPEYKNIIDVCC